MGIWAFILLIYFSVYSYPLNCTFIMIQFCIHDTFQDTNILFKIQVIMRMSGCKSRLEAGRLVGLQAAAKREAMTACIT